LPPTGDGSFLLAKFKKPKVTAAAPAPPGISMNEPSRREKIEAMLVDEPTDTFLRYSLAMELRKEGEHEQSIAQFNGLMRDDPPYVPAYFMCAQLLTGIGRIDEARTALREGIEHARTQGESHAAGEMSEYLAGLGELG